jgi:hypothetical protein
MAVEMNKTPNIRLTPGQEIKLAKPATELYVGQVLKAVVVTPLTNDQVLININGQNLNAKSSHQFRPGELLEVKVIANHNETVLEVQQKPPSLSILQSALLQVLPKQAPPTNLLQTLSQLANAEQLPHPLSQQIKAILSNITPLSQLPQQLMQAISRSGVFLESSLFEWQRGMSSQKLKADFKGQCRQLLESLPVKPGNTPCPTMESQAKVHHQDPLPLAGAIPQPMKREALPDLLSLTTEGLQHLLREQVGQVLARITANQIHHLSNDQNGYLMMLDLPIKTAESIDVIPLMIQQHKAEPMHPSKWSVSFALSLARLGDIQATVSLSAQSVDIKINTEKSLTMDTLNQYQDEMRTVLSESGLNLRHWKLQIGLESNHIDVANLHLLDIRI